MHVVLLGADSEAIQELADLGHTLTVVYANAQHNTVVEHRKYIHSSGYVPAYDIPELAWSTLLHLGVAGKVDLILPVHEMAVATAAILSRVLGITEKLDPLTAMAGRDKALQKSLWHASGVPTARFVTLTEIPETIAECNDILSGLTPPYIIKPTAQGGSKLVYACDSSEEVVARMRNNTGLRHAVVEERQVGTEWHFDGNLIDGRIEHLMVSRYMSPLIATQYGHPLRSVAYPPTPHSELYVEARDFAQQAVSALGGRWGVFHFEVFGVAGKFMAGELGWRPAGVLASLKARHAIGVSLWSAHVRSLLGEPVTVQSPADSAWGIVCLPVKPGARNGVDREDLVSLEGVRHVRMDVGIGEVMREMVASTVGVAVALVEGRNVEDCERLIDRAVQRTRDLHELKSS